jgi:hypothetical protein
LCRWAEEAGRRRPDVLRIGYFGSYARGNWGVGSDLDVVIVLEDTELPFERRGVEWDTFALPVPADLLVYTEREWGTLEGRTAPPRAAALDAVWVYARG